MKKWVKRSKYDGRIIRVLPYDQHGTDLVAEQSGIAPAEVLIQLKDQDNTVKTLVGSTWHVEEV